MERINNLDNQNNTTMTTRKEIQLDKRIVKAIIVSFILGYMFVLVINYWGDFTVEGFTTYVHGTSYDYTYYDSDTKIASLSYNTFFWTEIPLEPQGKSLEDTYSDGMFKSWGYTIPLLFKSTFHDFLYILLISLGIFIPWVFLLKFKVKLKN